MAYLLRFVQRFETQYRQEFLDLERRFVELERDEPGLPRGRRYLASFGREPQNTLVWECEFASLTSALDGVATIASHPRHDELFALQVRYITESYTEVYEAFDF